MTTKIGEKIKQFRSAKELTQEELARLSGLTKDYISKIERGEVSSFRTGTIESLSKALEVHPNEILYGDTAYASFEPPPQYRHLFRFIPLLSGNLSFKDFKEALNKWDGETLAIAKEVKGKNLVAWKVPDRSMEPNFSGEQDDIIIDLDFDRSQTNECDAVVHIGNGEVMLRNIKPFKDFIELRPYNPAFPTLKFTKKEMDSKKFEIIGTLAGLHRNFTKRKR